MTPETVKKSLAIVNQSLDMIYCIQDLCDLTGMKRNEVVSWIYRIYQRFDFFKIKREGKLRTFIFNKNITEERYKILFQKYYSTRIIKEKSIHTISGHDFEEFSTWAFIEYLKLKGIQLELTKVDKEPVDYIARMRLDISDLLGNNKHNNIVLTQFIISCKNYRLDRPLGSWYVLGLSGCLREGKTFRGETIFEPRNTVGIIFCTKASSYAYDMCGELGIRIIDLHKLLRMHEIVKAFTNNGHPLYDKIVSRIKMSREIKKASGVVKDG